MTIKLKDLKCTSCNSNTPKLQNFEIVENLNKLSNWNINDEQEMIFKKFIFNNFKKALNFANIIGKIAEEEGHHPDISLGWGYCLIMLHTHAINSLSINDFIMAAKIDLINKN